MGNDLPKPSNVLYPERVEEMKKISLALLAECVHYWKTAFGQSQTIGRKQFEELFGHLVKDPDLYFNTFQATGRVSTLEFICAAALMGNFKHESIHDKMLFIFSQFADLPMVYSKSCTIEAFQAVLASFSKLCNIKKITDAETIQFINQSKMVFVHYPMFEEPKKRPGDDEAAETPPAAAKPVVAAEVHDGVTFDELWQWFQDSKILAGYLDSVLSINLVNLVVDESDKLSQAALERESCKIQSHAEDSSEEVNCIWDFSHKRKYPLWQLFIHQIFQAEGKKNWLTPVVNIPSDESIFNILEHFSLSDNYSFPVYKSNTDVNFSRQYFEDPNSFARIHPSSLLVIPPPPSAVPITPITPRLLRGGSGNDAMFVTAPPANLKYCYFLPEPTSIANSSTLTCIETPGLTIAPPTLASPIYADENGPLVCIVDIIHIMCWFAQLAPNTSMSAAPPEIVEVFQGNNRRSSVNAAGLYSGMAPDRPHPHPPANSPHSMHSPHSSRSKPQSLGAHGTGANTSRSKGRRVSSNASVGILRVWQEIGEKTAWTTFSSVLLDCYALQQDPKLTQKNILHVDNFVYDVFVMIAKGYRSIPIAAIESQRNRVTHVISTLDIVDFVRLQLADLLPTMMKQTVQQANLMRHAVEIPVNTVFGDALKILAERKLDVAAIVDEDGIMSGRFEARCVLKLYESFKLLSNARRVPGSKPMPNKQQCMEEYKEGSYMMPTADRWNNSAFPIFNAYANPLSVCEDSCGVKIVNFERYMNTPLPPIATEKKRDPNSFAEEDEEESDGSSSSSTASSYSSTDSSTESDDSDDSESEDITPSRRAKMVATPARKTIVRKGTQNLMSAKARYCTYCVLLKGL